MRLACIQIHSKPAMVHDNVRRGIAMYQEAVEKGADCIIFPELWTCGYYLETPDFQAAAEKSPEILKMFCSLAKKDHKVIILPEPINRNGSLYIGLYVIENDGSVVFEYHKSFLWGREQNYFVHGSRKYEPVETSVGRLGLLICYDIEFPEPSRILALKGAQLIIVPSVWSIPALNRWDIQLPARALDNTVFVVGVNNVGEGACGHCKLIGPFGDMKAEASADHEEVLIADVDYDEISKVRSRIPYLAEYDTSLTPGGCNPF